MKTRTLLLLAVACGLVILVAGGVQLLRVANQDEPARPLRVGETARLGDATVTVAGVEADDAELVVSLRVSGVDDANGGDGFTLVTDAPQRPVENGCLAFTVPEQACELRFDVGSSKSQARVLVLNRVDERVRWDLNAVTTASTT